MKKGTLIYKARQKQISRILKDFEVPKLMIDDIRFTLKIIELNIEMVGNKSQQKKIVDLINKADSEVILLQNQILSLCIQKTFK